MNIILHIGQAKTGTTSIQKTLRANDQSCLQAGVLYPTIGNFREQHHLLELGFTHRSRMRFISTGFLPSPLLKRTFNRRDFELFWRSLQETVRTVRPQTLVLSSEMLFNDFSAEQRSPDALRNLIESLAPETNVRVVAYIRSPKAWFIANAQQLYRQNYRMPKPRLYSSVRQTTRYYTELFPGRVDLYDYDDVALSPGGTLTHLITHYLPQLTHLGLAEAGHGRENPTESIETLSQLYAAYDSLDTWRMGPLRSHLYWLARESVRHQKSVHSTPLSLKDPNAVIDTAWLREYRWMQETYGLRFSNDPWMESLDHRPSQRSQLSNQPTVNEIFKLHPSLIALTRRRLARSMMRAVPSLIKHIGSLEYAALRVLINQHRIG